LDRFVGLTPLSRLIPGDVVNIEPLVEIYETSEELLFFLAVPGFELSAIEVSVTPETLDVHGVRQPLFKLPENVRIYRRFGLVEQENFVFNYALPVTVSPENVKATLHQGILELHLPKIVSVKANTVKVNISAE
jgi:HSP20 family protein